MNYCFSSHLGLLTKWMARNQTGKPWSFDEKKSHMRKTTYCRCFLVCFKMGSKDAFGDCTSREEVAQAPKLLNPKRPEYKDLFQHIKVFSGVGENLEILFYKLLFPPNFLDFKMDLYFTA